MVSPARHLLQTILSVTRDLVSLTSSAMRSRAQLAAENLFLRKQLALYQERKVNPRRADDGTRISLADLSHFLARRQLLVAVTPETLVRWHRKGFRLFWRWRSRAPGRPPIPANVQRLIAAMASGESDLGRGTHCQRAARAITYPSVAADGAAIHAVASATSEAGDASLEHIRAEPRSVDPCE